MEMVPTIRKGTFKKSVTRLASEAEATRPSCGRERLASCALFNVTYCNLAQVGAALFENAQFAAASHDNSRVTLAEPVSPQSHRRNARGGWKHIENADTAMRTSWIRIEISFLFFPGCLLL